MDYLVNLLFQEQQKEKEHFMPKFSCYRFFSPVEWQRLLEITVATVVTIVLTHSVTAMD